MNKNQQQGAAVLVFVAITTVMAIMFLAISHAQSLHALKRSKAASDGLISTYEAESTINDVFARFTAGYDMSSYPSEITLSNGTKLKVDINDAETEQTVIVTAQRVNAVSIIQGYRQKTTFYEKVDMILSLDCTGSMDDDACDDCAKTRFEAQEDAAVNLIDTILALDNWDDINVGVIVFGIDAEWLKYQEIEAKPGNLSLEEIKTAITDGFGSKRNQSPVCRQVMDGTSIGSGYVKMYDYFNDPSISNRKVGILITDGEPNSRIPYPDCPPSEFCPGLNWGIYCKQPPHGWECKSDLMGKCGDLAKMFLACSISTARPPGVDLYGVTIYPLGEFNEIRTIFETNLDEDHYFNASNATYLTNILQDILEEIIQYSNIKVRRLIPLST